LRWKFVMYGQGFETPSMFNSNNCQCSFLEVSS
jgi:hypothetical protein